MDNKYTGQAIQGWICKWDIFTILPELIMNYLFYIAQKESGQKQVSLAYLFIVLYYFSDSRNRYDIFGGADYRTGNYPILASLNLIISGVGGGFRF